MFPNYMGFLPWATGERGRWFLFPATETQWTSLVRSEDHAGYMADAPSPGEDPTDAQMKGHESGCWAGGEDGP